MQKSIDNEIDNLLNKENALKKVVNIPTVPKPRGRPVGSTNKEKPVVVQPRGTLKEFKVVRYWENNVVITFPYEETKEYKVRESIFIFAVLKYGYIPGTTNKWKFTTPNNGFIGIVFT
jgi:hypothetical protein